MITPQPTTTTFQASSVMGNFTIEVPEGFEVEEYMATDPEMHKVFVELGDDMLMLKLVLDKS